MMRATTALALLLLTASRAFGQTAEPRPDYSRPTLLRIVVEREREERRGIRLEGGTVTFRALGSRWRFMPIMLPFAGTRFTTTREWPDAFSLTGTAIAMSPRAFRSRRELNKELRRIEKITKPKAKVKVKTQ